MNIAPTDLALPSDHEAALAKAASRALAHAGDKPLRVQVAGADREVTTVDLPPVVARLLMDILKETAAGHAVTLVPFQRRNHHTTGSRFVECLAPLFGAHDRQGRTARPHGWQSAAAAVQGRASVPAGEPSQASGDA
jgi:hypothetical protein